MVFRKIYIESQILTTLCYVYWQNTIISFENHLAKNLAILYPSLGNLTTQIAIFFVFHISNTARSTVIIAMHNSHFNRDVVTHGPIGPPKFCLLWNKGKNRPHVGLLWLAPQIYIHSDAPAGQCAHTWNIISGLLCAHVLLFE